MCAHAGVHIFANAFLCLPVLMHVGAARGRKMFLLFPARLHGVSNVLICQIKDDNKKRKKTGEKTEFADVLQAVTVAPTERSCCQIF